MQRNLLGTVGLSSGIPTGAVIETGTNANGTYTRFADGTQICTRTIPDQAVSSTSVIYGLYRSDLLSAPFPAAFASGTPVSASVGMDLPLSNGLFVSGGRQSNAQNWYYRFSGMQSFSGASPGTVSLMAIGRWA